MQLLLCLYHRFSSTTTNIDPAIYVPQLMSKPVKKQGFFFSSFNIVQNNPFDRTYNVINGTPCETLNNSCLRHTCNTVNSNGITNKVYLLEVSFSCSFFLSPLCYIIISLPIKPHTTLDNNESWIVGHTDYFLLYIHIHNQFQGLSALPTKVLVKPVNIY